MKKILSTFTFLALTFGSCYANEVNVFTSRHYDSDVKLYKKFTAKTGIKVNVVSGKAKALEKRILSEGKSSKADVFITVDAGNLGSAKAKGVFQSINSKTLKSKIPANFRTSHWYGVAKRARVIYYNPKLMSADEAKGLNYEDLSNPKYQNYNLLNQTNYSLQNLEKKMYRYLEIDNLQSLTDLCRNLRHPLHLERQYHYQDPSLLIHHYLL